MESSSQSVRALSLGVGIATGLYGISFGALAVTAGLSFWQTMALSLLMFSGGSQFAFIGVVAAGGGVVPAIASAWLLGVRNGFYALRLAPVVEVSKLVRPLAAQLTIDESNAVSLSQSPDKTKEKKGFWLTGISVFVFWNSFTALGALIGSQIGNPSDWGLDAAAAAAFLGLIWPRLRDRELLVVAISACLVAALLSLVLPSGLPVLMAAIVAFVFWGLQGKK